MPFAADLTPNATAEVPIARVSRTPAVSVVPPIATAPVPSVELQPIATCPAFPAAVVPPLAAKEDDPLASEETPIATVLVLPFATVALVPIAKPSPSWKEAPDPELEKLLVLPDPVTALTSCTDETIANAANIPATTIFFLPVLFFAISDTTT